MKDNKSISTHIPFNLCETCGEQATHLNVSVSHHEGTYRSPAYFYISTTPCVKTEFGFSMELTFGDNPYRVFTKLVDAPRFNRKKMELLWNLVLPIAKQLVENKVSSDVFKQFFVDLAAAIATNATIPEIPSSKDDTDDIFSEWQ